MKKKFFAIVLCMALIVTMLPFNAFAEGAEAQKMNTDTSIQEAEQADNAEDNISEAEQKSDAEDNEAYKVKILASENLSAAAGCIAKASLDDENNTVYTVMSSDDIYVSAGSENNRYYMGTETSGKFSPIPKDPDSYSITVKRDGWNEAVSKDNPGWENPLWAGGFEGGYEEEALYFGYNENAVFLGEDAYGAYHITVNWTIDENEYSAEMTLNLNKNETLAAGEFYSYLYEWEREQGFLKKFSRHEEFEQIDNTYILNYNPGADSENDDAVRTMILSNGENGLLDFKNSNCTIDGLFSKGEAVEYKSGVNVVPLSVDYSKVNSEAIDKTYTLTFTDSKGTEINRNICFKKNSFFDKLVDGGLYAISTYGAAEKNGNIYIGNIFGDITGTINDCVELTVKTPETYYFGIWKAESQTFASAELILSDLEQHISAVKNSAGYYKIVSSKSASGSIKAEEGGIIAYNATLPEFGIYSGREKTDEKYLADKIYLTDAAYGDDGAEFYFIFEGKNIKRNELGLSIEDNLFKISDCEDYVDDEGNRSYVWKITVLEEFNPEDGSDWLSVRIDRNGNVYNYLENVRVYAKETTAEGSQLYWIDKWGVEVDDEGLITSSDNYPSVEEQARKKIYGEGFGSKRGYFAIKDSGDNFYALDNAEVSDTNKIRISNSGFEYRISWKGIGKYKITAEADGRKYELNLSVSLPAAGFYSHPERMADNYLDEFHFADSAEKSEDETKAHFYFITPVAGYEADEVEVVAVEWNDMGERVATKVDGLSFEKPEKRTFDSENYFVCRITVSDKYRRNTQYDAESIALMDKNGKYINGESISIHDPMEVPLDRQLYWFDSYYVNADNEGKLTLKDNAGYDNIDNAAVRMIARNYIGTATGYFAVKADDGSYHAVNNVTVSDSDNLELTNDGFIYRMKWLQLKTYRFEAEKDGKIYNFNMRMELPAIGFYSHRERTPENYLNEEFYFADAAETNEDETEAYFYVIAETKDYALEKIDISVVEHNSESGVWEQKRPEGLSFGKPEKVTFDSKDYFVWKVTVNSCYREVEGDGGYNMVRVRYIGENDLYENKYIDIYDLTNIPESRQLYWFYSDDATAGENGQLTAAWDTTLDRIARNDMTRFSKGSEEVYFAVKDDNGDYYALDNVTVSDDNIGLSKEGFKYDIELNQFGEYMFRGAKDRKTYKLMMYVKLPYMGFYSSPDRSADKYLGTEMYFEDIPQKSKDKKEAVAYFITPAYSGKDNIKIEVGQYKFNSDSGEMEWQAENNDGIVFSNPKEAVFGTGKYCVWEVHIGDKYKLNRNYQIAAINTESQKPFDFLYNIVIHNADEVTPSQQIYYFLKYEEGTVENKGTLGDLICGVDYGFYYCAILKDGEYYKVDIADAKGIRYSVNETSGAITLIPENTGEYTITAVYDGKRYYSKGMIVLSDVGFWSEPNRSYETLLKEFNYNTADDKKHFYYISPSGYYWDDNAEILDVKDIVIKPYTWERGGNCIEASGIKIGECGSFTEAGQTYYYWEVIVDKSFDAESTGRYVHMQYNCSGRNGQSIAIKITGYKNYEDSVSVSGTVTSSDNTDNAEMMLYCVKDLKIFIEEEYTDSKAEAYIKSDIISTSHHSSSATEKGRITGAGGIYSQTYKFADVAAGEYKLAVYKPGYSVHIEDVTVTDSTVIGDIKLSLLGDANGDGKVRIGDKAVLARAIVGWTGYENLLNKDAADINGDGLIKNDDLMILSRHLAGWLGYSQLEYGKQQIKAE